jgi:mannan endo-1,4-beta-mannosidase
MTFGTFPVLLLLAVLQCSFAAFVTTTNSSFLYKGKEIFFSGANLAWVSYGNDFGNNRYNSSTRTKIQSYVDDISLRGGGNSIRVWLFVEGSNIPEFASNGTVVSTDEKNSLVSDVKQFAQYAASKNVFVILCLWNGALMREKKMKGLFYSDTKLASFIKNALTPLVRGLVDEAGIAAYEIINEPEGSLNVNTVNATEKCFDTKSVLLNSGAGWAGANIRIERMQRFINWQASAIKEADANALVTVGAWSEYSSTNVVLEEGRRFFNYWSDECLVKAGRKPKGILNFYQIHTYASAGTGRFSKGSPFNVKGPGAYQLDKPVLIGEFSERKCLLQGCTIKSLYSSALEKQFGGVLDWSLIGGDGNDDEKVAIQGMRKIRGSSKVIVRID